MSAWSRPTGCAGSAIMATRRSTRSTWPTRCKRIEGMVYTRLHDAGAAPAIGRRRPSRHPADPARNRPRAACGRSRSFRRPLRAQSDSYFGGEKYTHGTPFRPRHRGKGLIDPKRIDPDRRARLDLFAPTTKDWAGERRHPDRPYRGILPARPRCGGRRGAPHRRRRPDPISRFDVDGLDPVHAPGTGTPEIGGFSTAKAQRMIRALARASTPVGGDVVEVRAALRSQRQYRPGRRRHDVRDPLRRRPGGAPPQEPHAAAMTAFQPPPVPPAQARIRDYQRLAVACPGPPLREVTAVEVGTDARWTNRANGLSRRISVETSAGKLRGIFGRWDPCLQGHPLRRADWQLRTCFAPPRPPANWAGVREASASIRAMRRNCRAAPSAGPSCGRSSARPMLTPRGRGLPDP